MDKPRANPPKKRGKLYAAITVVAAVIITLGLSQLKPAPPSVERELAWTFESRDGPTRLFGSSKQSVEETHDGIPCRRCCAGRFSWCGRV